MEFRTQLSKNGRIVVPAKLRRALGLQTGDEILLRLEDGSIRLLPLRQAVHMAQESVQRYVTKGSSLVDDLIADRREESGRE
jgi:AbrB family looped-hinge helix DNA binding protein